MQALLLKTALSCISLKNLSCGGNGKSLARLVNSFDLVCESANGDSRFSRLGDLFRKVGENDD